MLEVLYDNLGEIKAVCEYYVVDKYGHMDDKGAYIWVNDCVISPKYRNNGCLINFVKIITNRYPQAKYGYFKREKYNNRVHMYSKNQWLRGGSNV